MILPLLFHFADVNFSGRSVCWSLRVTVIIETARLASFIKKPRSEIASWKIFALLLEL
jgi:hypothetical protein